MTYITSQYRILRMLAKTTDGLLFLTLKYYTKLYCCLDCCLDSKLYICLRYSLCGGPLHVLTPLLSHRLSILRCSNASLNIVDLNTKNFLHYIWYRNNLLLLKFTFTDVTYRLSLIKPYLTLSVLVTPHMPFNIRISTTCMLNKCIYSFMLTVIFRIFFLTYIYL